MARDDEAGAIAAAEYFMTELYPYVVTTGDTAAWNAMSAASCKFCASVSERRVADHDDYAIAELAPIRFTDAAFEMVEPALFRVTFAVAKGPDSFFAADGTLVDSNPATTGRAGLHLHREGAQWTVAGVNLIQDQAATP